MNRDTDSNNKMEQIHMTLAKVDFTDNFRNAAYPAQTGGDQDETYRRKVSMRKYGWYSSVKSARTRHAGTRSYGQIPEKNRSVSFFPNPILMYARRDPLKGFMVAFTAGFLLQNRLFR